MPQPHESDSQHVDLCRIDWLAREAKFVRRLPLNDRLLVKANGEPTQLAEGSATYMEISEPHTMKECPYV